MRPRRAARLRLGAFVLKEPINGLFSKWQLPRHPNGTDGSAFAAASACAQRTSLISNRMSCHKAGIISSMSTFAVKRTSRPRGTKGRPDKTIYCPGGL